MGKKDKEKEAAKKAAKAAKQAVKTAKSAKKKAFKGDDEVEEDIEKILAELALAEAKKTAVHVAVVERPTARANFSLTALPSAELIMFGGEYWNGQHNICYNELYRFTPSTSEWKLVTSPNTPPPRCSHQAVLVSSGASHFLYIFGGEFATNMQFYHYSDTWKLELATNKWTKVECKKSPSARSGHRMVTWRNYIVLFGGFHQSYTSDVWHKDLWVFDTRTNEWKEVVIPTTAQQPSARSGMQFHIVPGKDVCIMYGGYSEVKNVAEASAVVSTTKGKPNASAAAAAMLSRKSRSVVHTDLWLLKLAPLATGSTPTWERVRYTGAAPPARLSFSMAMYRDRAVLFGGVSDKDVDERGELVESQFFNDMYSYDMERRRWYKLELKKSKTGGRRAKTSKGKAGALDDDDDRLSLGSADDEGSEDEEELRAAKGEEAFDENAFYYYENGKLVKLEMDTDEAGVDASETTAVPSGDATKADDVKAADAIVDESVLSTKKKKKKMVLDDEISDAATPHAATPSLTSPSAAAGTAAVSTPAVSEAAQPAGRMKAQTWIDGHFLYLFGGLSEGKTREITYDDLWRIDLRDRVKWDCVLPARMHEWKGEDSDDEDEDDEEEDDDDDDDGDDDEEDNEDDGADGDGAASGDEAEAAAGAGETHTSRRARGRGPGGTKENVRLQQLRARLGLEDASITPQAGERLGVFFARTANLWINEYMTHHLMEGERIEGKQLRKKAFALAKQRYDEIWPTLAELYELEEEQRQQEAEAAAVKRRPVMKSKVK